MTLGDLLLSLEMLRSTPLLCEVGEIDSYRGNYHDMYIDSNDTKKMFVSEFIEHICKNLGTFKEGYKGGEFICHHDCEIYLSTYGVTGGLITGLIIKKGEISFEVDYDYNA
jgi:hypothetical protein